MSVHVDLVSADGRDALIAGLVVPCCMGFAVHGPEGCTCWEPVLEPMPTGAPQEGPPVLRRTCCRDCAYRNGSPERTPGGEQETELDDVATHAIFLCHAGMPLVVEWRHPSGAVFVPGFDHYEAFKGAGRAWKADGSPAELCAGWAARRRALLGSV